MALNREAMTD